jgi:uracil phosphoribosyltransferase
VKTPLLGSYSSEDCLFLLKKIEPNFYTVEDKERLIQTGQLHYSQMVSQESKPSFEYEQLFYSLTSQYKQQLADEILKLSFLISKNIKQDICIVSLVRAGTPIGVLVNKGLNQYSAFNSVHYSISIVRDKGIDVNALDYLIFDLKISPQSIVFIDGWTAKGIITKELKQAIQAYNKSRNVNISDDLYVVSDIGGTADYSVTVNDYTIPSALMNSTVSGLISRSVINDQIGKDDFHGCISYEHLEKHDQSNWFVDEISSCFSESQFQAFDVTTSEQRDSRYQKTQQYILELMRKFNVSDINRIKPGIAEATRVMLRRVPDLLIINDDDNPDIQHLLRIAEEKNINTVILPELPFGACALIKDVGKK